MDPVPDLIIPENFQDIAVNRTRDLLDAVRRANHHTKEAVEKSHEKVINFIHWKSVDILFYHKFFVYYFDDLKTLYRVIYIY